MTQCSICDNESCSNDKWSYFNVCLEHVVEMAELAKELTKKEESCNE